MKRRIIGAREEVGTLVIRPRRVRVRGRLQRRRGEGAGEESAQTLCLLGAQGQPYDLGRTEGALGLCLDGRDEEQRATGPQGREQDRSVGVLREQIAAIPEPEKQVARAKDSNRFVLL